MILVFICKSIVDVFLVRKIGIGRRLRKIKKKTFYVKQGFDKYEKTVKNYFIDMPD